MADTNRARSALETLFADNTSGDISPQDLRDFLRSIGLLNVPNAQTGTTYTFVLADADNTVTLANASAITVTIPANASVAFPIGTRIPCVRKGAGLVTFAVAGGVTLNKPTGIKPNRFMGALAKKAADQTTANYTSQTAVAWDSESYDTDVFHDTVTNNSRLTVPSGLGIKKVTLSAVMHTSSVTANLYQLYNLFKNGAGSALGGAGIVEQSALGDAVASFVTPPLTVADADYFQAMLLIQTDTSITVESEESCFGIEVVEIDPIGTIAYQYGMVWLEKIDTNEWNIYGPALG